MNNPYRTPGDRAPYPPVPEPPTVPDDPEPITEGTGFIGYSEVGAMPSPPRVVTE